MTKSRVLLLPFMLFVAMITSGLLLSGLVGAHSFRTGDSVTTAANELIDQTLFAAGKTLTIESKVNGDVFCAGQTVLISGEVDGDVICAAQNITLTGNVTGDIRIAAQSFTLSSNVAGNASVAVDTFVQDSSSTIDGDLSIAGADATINGAIGRDIALAGDMATINGAVGRNIVGDVIDLELLSAARVAGNIDYKSVNELVKSDAAVVSGEISRTIPESEGASVFGVSLWFVIYLFAATLITSLVLILLAPRFFNSVTAHGMPRPWKAALVGFLLSIAAPVVLVVLFISTVGIPLAALFTFGWLFAVLLSTFFSAYLVGRWILKGSTKPVSIMLVGSMTLLIGYFLPVIGFFIFVFAYFAGLGMLFMELYSRNPKPSYDFSEQPAKAKKAKK